MGSRSTRPWDPLTLYVYHNQLDDSLTFSLGENWGTETLQLVATLPDVQAWDADIRLHMLVVLEDVAEVAREEVATRA